MTELEDVSRWLDGIAGDAQKSADRLSAFARVHAQAMIELAHNREVISRAIEWHIASVLLERAPAGSNVEFARAHLEVTEAALRVACDRLVNLCLG